MNASALATTTSVSGTPPPPPADEAEHEREDEVLEHEDPQHEVGLLVGQPAEVDQALHRDRARGDVHRSPRASSAPSSTPNATTPTPEPERGR